MGIWDSVRSTVDKVTGGSANLTLDTDGQVVRPEQTVNVRIVVKNGLSTLEARAILLEIESIETINLPRHANLANIVEDVLEAGNKRTSHGTKPHATQNSDKVFSATINVSPALTFAVGEERKFQGTFRLPANVQPTYEGKYATHSWRMRARLDVFGTDPSTPWYAFRVIGSQ